MAQGRDRGEGSLARAQEERRDGRADLLHVLPKLLGVVTLLALFSGLCALVANRPGARGPTSFDEARVASRVEEPTPEKDLVTVVEEAVRDKASGEYTWLPAALSGMSSEGLGVRWLEEYNSLYIVNVGLKEYLEGTLKVGDRIIAVDGLSGASSVLSEQLQQKKMFDLELLRMPEDGYYFQPRPLDFFEAFIDRTGGESLGARFDVSKDSLLVQSVHGGLFGAWNDENAGPATIRPGVRIIAVNGDMGSGKRLLGECFKENIMEIRFMKVFQPPPTTTPAPTTPAPKPAPTPAPKPKPVGREDVCPKGCEFMEGLMAEYWYNINQDLLQTPGLSKDSLQDSMHNRLADLTRVDKQIYYPSTSFGWVGLPKTSTFAARWMGQILIDTPGRYLFQIRSSDGASLAIDNRIVLGHRAFPDFTQHDWQTEPGHQIDLTAGPHDLVVNFFNLGRVAGVIVSYAGPDTEDSIVAIPARALRVPVAVLPKDAMEDHLVRKFDGSISDVFLRGISSTIIGNMLVAATVLGAISYGVALLGSEARRRWRQRRDYSSLSAALAGGPAARSVVVPEVYD